MAALKEALGGARTPPAPPELRLYQEGIYNPDTCWRIKAGLLHRRRDDQLVSCAAAGLSRLGLQPDVYPGSNKQPVVAVTRQTIGTPGRMHGYVPACTW